MKCCIINLVASIDRRAYMTKQMESFNLDYEFLPATEGKNLEQKWLKFCRSDTANMLLGNIGFSSKNEIASFASHYRLWQRCCELNEPIIIFEDDVKLVANFNARLPLITSLVNKFNYLRLFALEQQRGSIAITPYLTYYYYYPVGAQAYAITPQGAKQLIKHARYWTEPADIYLDKYWLHGLQPYCITPMAIFEEEAFVSEINNTVQKKQYLPKPRGVIKLCRELFVRPWQQWCRYWFELTHPVITQQKLIASIPLLRELV